jgi:hypothetical protein
LNCFSRIHISVDCAAVLKQIGNQSRPPRLVTCSQAASVVTVKIFEEKQQVAPVRIALELFERSVHRATSLAVAQEDANQSALQFNADLLQVHPASGARRTLHSKTVTQEAVELPQRLDDQEIDRKPDGAPPVRVASQKSAVRIGGDVIYEILCIAQPQSLGMFTVKARKRTDAVGREKLRFVQHDAQDPAKPLLGHE